MLARYDAAFNILPEKDVDIEYSDEFLKKKERVKAPIGITNDANPFVRKLLLRKGRWTELVKLQCLFLLAQLHVQLSSL